MRFEGLFRTLARAVRGEVALATLGALDGPRQVSLIGKVARQNPVRSPVSGIECAYFHAEIGETVELAWPKLRSSRERYAFRPFAELKSQCDLVVATADGERVVLPAGYFLVRATEASRRGRPLERIPDAISAQVSPRQRDSKWLGYREIALWPGEPVRFSGTIETVLVEARDGYRDEPRRALRMRPEREPIVVEPL